MEFKGTQSGWSGLDSELPFTHDSLTEADGGNSGKKKITFTFDTASGVCSLTKVAADTTTSGN